MTAAIMIYAGMALLTGANFYHELRDPISLDRVGRLDALWGAALAGALWLPWTAKCHVEDLLRRWGLR